MRNLMLKTSFPSLFDDFWPALRYDDFIVKKSNSPLVNVSESEQKFNLEVSLPGYSKDEINIDVENGMITISSEKKEENNSNKWNRKEFYYSSFKRSFSLPDGVDVNSVEASFKDGILNIGIPKKEVKKLTKKILVN